jgi:hypothetical protein
MQEGKGQPRSCDNWSAYADSCGKLVRSASIAVADRKNKDFGQETGTKKF